jgi:two-component system, response regulator PdtaR
MNRILVVEDEAIVALSLCIQLKQAGYDTLPPAATGEQAIKLVREQNPDAVLMDINLANSMNGIEAGQSIRSFSSIPIIFTSGYGNEDLKQQALKLQPAEYLVKPLSFHRLHQLLSALV